MSQSIDSISVQTQNLNSRNQRRILSRFEFRIKVKM